MRNNFDDSESNPQSEEDSRSREQPASFSQSQIWEHTLYDELRKLAAARLAHEKPGQTLQATALVHEAYVRLMDVDKAQQWNNRGHFFAAAAEAMRRILIEKVRHKGRQRRGGQLRRCELSDADRVTYPVSDELLDLDQAISDLASVDAQAAEMVTLRVFAGVTINEAAELLEISPRNAKRVWAYARAWIGRKIHQE